MTNGGLSFALGGDKISAMPATVHCCHKVSHVSASILRPSEMPLTLNHRCEVPGTAEYFPALCPQQPLTLGACYLQYLPTAQSSVCHWHDQCLSDTYYFHQLRLGPTDCTSVLVSAFLSVIIFVYSSFRQHFS